MGKSYAALFPHLSTGKVPLAMRRGTGKVPHMPDQLYLRIKQRLAELGMSEREASMKVSGTADLIRNIKRGKSESLRGPRLVKLATILGVSAVWLQTGEHDHIPSEEVAAGLPSREVREHSSTSSLQNYKGEIPGAVPEVDARAGAGSGRVGDHEVVTLQRGETYVGHRVISDWVFPSAFLRHELHVQPGGIMVLEVVGDSMSPTLETGDRVIVDTSHSRPSPDGIYVIEEGDGPMVKRLQLVRRSEPAEVRIISDNSHHETYTLRLDDIRIIGRVSGRVSRM